MLGIPMLPFLIIKNRRTEKEFLKEKISHAMPTCHLNHPAFHQEYLSHTLEDTALGNREPFKNSGLDRIHDLGKLF